MKLLLVDPLPPSLVESMRSEIPRGHQLEAVAGPTEEEFLSMATDADVFLVIHRRIDRHVLDTARRLRFVQRFGVGYDNIDLGAARERGVTVAYTPGANAYAVAEHTVMLILALMKRLSLAAEETRAGHWPFGDFVALGVPDLADATVGLVGMGQIARAVSVRLRPFGCRVRYYSRHRRPPEEESALEVSYLDLDELLLGSDVVSIHLPLTPETRGMFGRGAFARMSRGAIFINTARGELVDEEALYDAVASGHLAGAGLDVLAHEGEGGNVFADLPQVVVTPHYAGVTRGAQRRIQRMGLGNVLRFIAGERPEHVLVDGAGS